MSQKCRQFATDLLELCEDDQEVALLLNQREGFEVVNRKGVKGRYPRLQVALHYRQLEVCVHFHHIPASI